LRPPTRNDSADGSCKLSFALRSTVAASISGAGGAQTCNSVAVEWPISLMIINASRPDSPSRVPRRWRRTWNAISLRCFSRYVRGRAVRASRRPERRANRLSVVRRRQCRFVEARIFTPWPAVHHEAHHLSARKMPQAGSVMQRLGALRRKIILEVLDLAQPLHDVRHLFGCSGCSG